MIPNTPTVRLYHVSESADIDRFVPRPHPNFDEPVVWAIAEARLVNYLLPRDCPRVTFYASETTSLADREQFLLGSPAVVAVEAAWLSRIRACSVHLYQLPERSFVCIDAGAGYYVSQRACAPVATAQIDDLPAAIIGRGAELRIVPSLWPLRDAVLASTLQFSFIRMRHAAPRPNPDRATLP